MSKRLIFATILLLTISSLVCTQSFSFHLMTANARPVRNLNTGLNYATIQEAIDAVETLDGNTISVNEGTYYENVVVNKSLQLVGEDRETTIIDGGKTGTAVNITACNVTLTHFAIKNSGNLPSVCLYWANFTSVADNIIEQSGFGIELLSSNNNTIDANQISDNLYHGVVLQQSHNNTVKQNNLTRNNSEAINLFESDSNYMQGNKIFYNKAAIWMDRSFCNVLSNNSVQNCTVSYYHVIAVANSEGNWFIGNNINSFNRTHQGVALYGCNESLVVGNNIQNCEYGLYLASSNGNRIYHNNVANTTHQAYVFETSLGNAWDNGVEGNYWSDYNFTDLNHDGVGDTPYTIDADNTDHYPLMGMFSEFSVIVPPSWKTEYVTVISNSTISDLTFPFWLSSPYDGLQPGQPFIQFYAAGENGSVGFCRIMVPKTVLNSSAYVVLVDLQPVNATLLPISNDTHAYLYFTYTHSTHEIIVTIPEFPSCLVFLAFIATTFATTKFWKRRH